MYWSVWAIVTKEHTKGGLNYRHFFFHSSGKLEALATVPADLVSSEAALPGLWTATFSPCPYTVSAHAERELCCFFLFF